MTASIGDPPDPGSTPPAVRPLGPRRRSLALLVIVLIAVAALGYALTRPAPPHRGGLTVAGNGFYVDGHPFVPHGFNSVAALDSPWCTGYAREKARANFGSAEFAAARAKWHANTLRFQVSQPVLSGVHGVAYAHQIAGEVARARQAGFLVDVSMQDEPPGCGSSQPLPSDSSAGPTDTDTVRAWQTLLTNTTIKDDPYVMFELYNEPNNVALTARSTNPQLWTWPDWLHGGRPIQPRPGQLWRPYTPIGMQTLTDVLRRDLGVSNVLVVDGAEHAATFEGMPLVRDPGGHHQIAYAVHPYSYTDTRADWARRWGDFAASHPVIATEWNCDYDTSPDRAAQTAGLLEYLRSTRVGVLGHTLDEFPGSLMSDAALDPTSCGELLRRYYTDRLSAAPEVPGGTGP